MAVQTLGSTISATNPTQSAASAATKKMGGAFDDFLTLLTAQITHQDPLEPMDSTLFVTQLAQLTQVEQSVATNTNLEAIRSALASNSAAADLALIGKSVVSEDNSLGKSGDEPVHFSFELAGPAEKADISVKDASGRTVKTFSFREGMTGELMDVSWDGKLSDGTTAPDGAYTLSLTATTNADESVAGYTFTSSKVKGVSYETGQPMLHLGNGRMIPSDLIVAVST